MDAGSGTGTGRIEFPVFDRLLFHHQLLGYEGGVNVYEVGTDDGVVRMHVLVPPGNMSTPTDQNDQSPLNE